MPKKKKPSSSRPSAQAPTPRAQSSPAKPAAEGRGARKRGRSGAIVAIVALAIAAIGALVYFFRSEPAQVSSTPSTAVASASAANYVGSEACGGCHVNERNAWRGSDHDLAMQVADEKTVLADFANAKFTYAGTTSTFSRRDGHFFVNTDGPDGKLNDYQIKYTFGVRPLQQYLIEFPGGRLQALGIAWDSRSKADGGQRWFHLYPKQNIKAGDWLHWTAAGQNWNFMCAECHSTDLRKNFDAATNAFNTTWKELDVACEACHGPGSDHVAWARDPAKAKGANKGLALALDERRGVTWSPLPNGNSQRSAPRSTAREIEMCARCHGRAARISDDYVYGAPPLDSRRLALLDDGLYWNDGQMRDEVYNWGSFVQSKMFAAGVTCSDCHDPHSLKLRQPGNAVCGQCHQPQKYDSEAHTHHAAGTPGAACAACHMPTTTYMVVDPRHDHSMRIPRPDLSVKLDVPNACNQCHTAKSPQWAADAIREWHGKTPIGYQNFANALRAGSVGAPGARGALLTLIDDPKQPAIVRASAIERLGHWLTPTLMASVSRSLNDPDPLVRLAAVESLTMRGK